MGQLFSLGQLFYFRMILLSGPADCIQGIQHAPGIDLRKMLMLHQQGPDSLFMGIADEISLSGPIALVDEFQPRVGFKDPGQFLVAIRGSLMFDDNYSGSSKTHGFDACQLYCSI